MKPARTPGRRILQTEARRRTDRDTQTWGGGQAPRTPNHTRRLEGRKAPGARGGRAKEERTTDHTEDASARGPDRRAKRKPPPKTRDNEDRGKRETGRDPAD